MDLSGTIQPEVKLGPNYSGVCGTENVWGRGGGLGGQKLCVKFKWETSHSGGPAPTCILVICPTRENAWLYSETNHRNFSNILCDSHEKLPMITLYKPNLT